MAAIIYAEVLSALDLILLTAVIDNRRARDTEDISGLITDYQMIFRNIGKESVKQKHLEIITTTLSINKIIRLVSKIYPIGA